MRRAFRVSGHRKRPQNKLRRSDRRESLHYLACRRTAPGLWRVQRAHRRVQDQTAAQRVEGVGRAAHTAVLPGDLQPDSVDRISAVPAQLLEGFRLPIIIVRVPGEPLTVHPVHYVVGWPAPGRVTSRQRIERPVDSAACLPIEVLARPPSGSCPAADVGALRVDVIAPTPADTVTSLTSPTAGVRAVRMTDPGRRWPNRSSAGRRATAASSCTVVS